MDDLIKRQTILDAIDEIETEIANGLGFQYEKWKSYFSEIDSDGIKWFTLSEREPEWFSHVLVTVKSEDEIFVSSDDYYSYGFDDWKDDVIAWAEAPGPYGGDENE